MVSARSMSCFNIWFQSNRHRQRRNFEAFAHRNDWVAIELRRTSKVLRKLTRAIKDAIQSTRLSAAKRVCRCIRQFELERSKARAEFIFHQQASHQKSGCVSIRLDLSPITHDACFFQWKIAMHHYGVRMQHCVGKFMGRCKSYGRSLEPLADIEFVSDHV